MPVLADTGFAYQQANPTDTYNRAVEQRVSLMERAQASQRQEQLLAMQREENERKRLEFEVQRPILEAQAAANIAGQGAIMYATKRRFEDSAKLSAMWPALQEKITQAAAIKKPDGTGDYEAQANEYSKILADVAPYIHTEEGKKAADVLEFLSTKAWMARAKEMDIEEKKTAKEIAIMRIRAQKQTAMNAAGELVTQQRDEEGNVISETPHPQGAELAGKRAGAEATAKNLAEANVKYNTSKIEEADAAVGRLESLKTAKSLLASGRAETGFGQKEANVVRGIFGRVGIGDPNKLADNQYLQANLQNFTLELAKRVMKGTGQVTDTERGMLERAFASIGLSREANLKLLDYAMRVDQRNVDLGRMANQMRSAGIPEGQIAAKLHEELQNREIDMSDLFSGEAGGGDMESPIAFGSVDEYNQKKADLKQGQLITIGGQQYRYNASKSK